MLRGTVCALRAPGSGRVTETQKTSVKQREDGETGLSTAIGLLEIIVTVVNPTAVMCFKPLRGLQLVGHSQLEGIHSWSWDDTERRERRNKTGRMPTKT